MLNFLSQMHNVSLFLFLSGVSVSISVAAVLLVKRLIPLELRYTDNPVLGNISALIGIIYGVLAGLTALYLITNISDTSKAIHREANAFANMYRDSKWLEDPARTKIQTEIKAYLERVTTVEWTRMKQGLIISHDGDVNIEKISSELSKYDVTSNANMLIVQQMLDEIRSAYNARQERITASYAELSPEIWIVILLGTILTMVINYLFGMNIYLHLLTVIAATLMAFSMIFLLITLDRPFQGEFVIEADSFKPVLEFIKNK